jgi:cytochrome c553
MRVPLVMLLVGCTHAVPPIPPVGDNASGWTTWSHEQKLAYMKETVLPAEQRVFAQFEPVRFAYFTCATCHGQSARDGRYTMPNPDLPHLIGGKQGFMELAEKQPETLRFMQKVVVPETARLLGYPPFDMEKHVGFSCYQCHVREDVKE